MKKKVCYIGIPVLALMLLGLYWNDKRDMRTVNSTNPKNGDIPAVNSVNSENKEVVLTDKAHAKRYFEQVLSQINASILSEQILLEEIDAEDSMESFGRVLGASFDSMVSMQKLTQGNIMAQDGLNGEDLDKYVGQLNSAMETFGRLHSDLNEKISYKMKKYGSEAYIQKIIREKSSQINQLPTQGHVHDKTCKHDHPTTP